MPAFVTHGTPVGAQSVWLGQVPLCRRRCAPARQRYATMSFGGGFLGVGPSEVAVIVGVGWFLLGPEKLFSLSRDVGKVLGQLRRTADEAKETLTDAFEVDMAALEAKVDGKEKGEQVEDGESEKEVEERIAEDATAVATAMAEEDVDTVLDGVADDVMTASVPERSMFLEQLQRANDPNQVAPSDVPDLSAGDVDLNEEEEEVARLEREYNEARARLAMKKSAAKAGETNSNGTVEAASVTEPQKSSQPPQR